MALKPDFQNLLQFFIFTNLPTLMNPGNATNVVVSNDIISTIPTSPITTGEISFLIMISPDLLKALQSYTLNNFPYIGLPQDIEQIAKDFIANLPPVIPIANTATTTITS